MVGIWEHKRWESTLLDIDASRNGNTLTLSLAGRLDTITSPELCDVLEASLKGVDRLILDFSKVTYLSSAGIRTIINSKKMMSKRDGMVVRNVSPEVLGILKMSGIIDYLDVE